MLPKWFAPAALVTAIGGSLWFLRKKNLEAKAGDYVAVNPAALGPPAGLPLTLPPNTRMLVRVDAIAPDGSINGPIVGYLDSGTGAPFIFGGAAGVPTPAPIQRAWITATYRGNPLTLVA